MARLISSSQLIVQHCADVLSVLIWVLSLVGGLRRRSRRTVAALVILAYSPLIVLVAGAYGDEGILRVYLFSLPWSAALAAAVLTPTPRLPVKPRRGGEDGESRRIRRFRAEALRAPVVLAVVVALFLVAFFGSDQWNTMSASEVASITSFQQTAPGGPILAANGNAPLNDTARYNLFPFAEIFGSGGVFGTKKPQSDIALDLADQAARYK